MVAPVVPKTDPEVVRVMRGFRRDLLLEERRQMEAMAQTWLAMEGRLRANMRIVAQAAVDGELSENEILALNDMQRLLAQVEVETLRYVDYAAGMIGENQAVLGRKGIEHAAEALRATYSAQGVMGSYFMVLNVDAVEAMVGLTGDGSPLREYLFRLYPQAADGMRRKLIETVALGRHPNEVAKEMAEGLGVGLNTAFNTARTEPLRVYRESSRMQYQESGVVRGYKRLSARDSDTCAACLMADGQFYLTEADFEEHNQGRCTPVPWVVGTPEPVWEYGADWFQRQDEGTQRQVLGAGRFEAWREGSFDLMDVVKRVEDPVWGNRLVPAPLKELVH